MLKKAFFPIALILLTAFCILATMPSQAHAFEIGPKGNQRACLINVTPETGMASAIYINAAALVFIKVEPSQNKLTFDLQSNKSFSFIYPNHEKALERIMINIERCT